MATAVTLALIAITTTTNVESLFVLELPESLTLKVLDDPVTVCVTTVETTVLVVVVAVGLIADEGLTAVVVFCCTKEELGVS